MEYHEDLTTGQSNNNDVQTALLTRLKELRQQSPERFSMPIDVLTAVDDTVEGQLERRLQLEKKNHMGKRITLIPYNFGNSHWIGILIEFEADGQIKRAEYIDPVNGSNLIPYRLQMQFAKVYPDGVLQTRNLLKKDDPKQSAMLTIKNLLIAAENVSRSTTDDQEREAGNKVTLPELKQRLDSGLAKWKIQDVHRLSREMKEAAKQIERHERKGRMNEAEKEKTYLRALKELVDISKEIAIRQGLELDYLEKELKSGLEKQKIRDVAKLPEEIQDTEKKIEKHRKKGKWDDVENEKIYLSELNELRQLAETISILKYDRGSFQILRDELTTMPACAEKSTMELLVHFKQRLLNDRMSSQKQDSGIGNLRELHDQIKRQELVSEETRIILQDLDSAVRSNNCSSVARLLEELLKKIKPINIPEIQRLVAKSEKAAALIRDKDIILLVGATGSGKSTTIQFLAGSTMRETKVEVAPGRFMEHITTVGPCKNPELDSVTSSAQMKPETRYIVPVTIQLRDIVGLRQTGYITLCDAPDFGDTASVEVDVANGGGVIEALKGCKSVKLLVLLSYPSLGDRGQGIQKLAHILISMLDGIQDKLDAICYAFTKYPPKIDIHALLTNIKTYQVDPDSFLRSDSAFVAVLSDMITKTASGAQKIDPVRDSPRQLIEQLLRVRGITNPGEVLRFSMSVETQAAVAKQVQRYKLSVMCAVKHKDIPLVMYYLANLKMLKDLINQNVVRDAYEDSIRFVGENVNDYFADVMQKFNRVLTSQDGLREEDIFDYKISIEYIEQIQTLREHLGSELISAFTLMENIRSELQKRSLALKEESLDSSLIGIYLHNLRMLKTFFKEFELQYIESCKDFAKRCEELVQSARESISANEFEQLAGIILTVSKSSYVLKDHLGGQNEEKHRNIVKILLQYLSSFSEKIDPILAKIRLSSSDLEILKNYIVILRSAKDNSALQDRISTYVKMLTTKTNTLERRSIGQVSRDNSQDLDSIYNEFIAKILRYFDKISVRIEEQFEKSGDHALEHIEKFVADMEAIRTIPELEPKTAGTYYRTVESVRGYIQQLQKDAEQFLVGIEQQSGTISYTHLARLLARLKNAEWIDRIIPGTYDISVHRITEELVHYAQLSEDRLVKLDLSLKYPENICVAQEILGKIELMSILERSIPKLEEWRISIFQRFFQSTQAAFDHIQKTFNLQDNVVYQIKQELKELEQIKREYENLHPARTRLREQAYPNINVLNREIETLQNTHKAESDLALSSLHSIRKEYDSLLMSRDSVSSEEMSFLREKGFHSPKLLDQAIQEKKRIIIEREKNKQPYNFSNGLDAAVANNALMYVSQCEKVVHVRVKEIAADTTMILQKYIREYGSFLNHEIHTNFQYARSIDAEGGPLQYSHDLEMRLRELLSFRKYAHVFECLDGAEKIENWHQQFLDYHHNLSDKIEQLKASGRNKDLTDQLIVAQALSCLDRCCSDVFLGNGFGVLYRQCQLAVNIEAKETYRIVLDSISKGDYANTAMALTDIVDGPLNVRDLAQIKHDLHSSLNTLMKDTKSIAYWLDGKIEREDNRNQIKEIKENIEKIRLALSKNSIMKLLDAETQSRLRSFENEINKVLSEIILRRLNAIEALMNADSFCEAEQGMENLNHVQHELAGHCISSSVTEKSEQLRERLDDLVTEISQRDDFADIDNYCVNPPKDLLAKLKMVASRGDARFHQAYIFLLGKIRQNFSRAIDQMRVASLNERSGRIRSLNYALCFLPDELQTLFKVQIDEVSKLLTDEEKTYRRDLDEALRGTDEDEHAITNIGVLAQQYTKQNMDELFEKLRDEILRKLNIYRTNAESCFERQDMQSAVDIVKKIFRYRESLSSYIPEIKGIYASVRDLTSKSFTHCSDTLTNIQVIEETQTVEKALSNMIICIDFSTTFHKTAEQFLPESVLRYGTEGFQKMYKYLNDNSRKYRIAISNMNTVELHTVLTIAKRWDGLVQKITQCRLKHDSIQTLLKDIRNVIPYADMINELEKQITNLGTELNVELISDETTKFEGQRDKFFSDLMESISAVREIHSKLKDFLPSKLSVEKLEEEIKKKVQVLCEQLRATASKTELSLREADQFRMYYNHLASFDKHVRLSGFNARNVLEASEEKILAKVTSLHREIAASGSDVRKVAELLIKMKFLAENLSMFDSKINAEIDEALKIFKVKGGAPALMQLTMVLEKTDIGGRLISEHSCLSGEDWRRRREKMQKQDDLDYVLRELDGDDIAMDVLRAHYQTFRRTYDGLVSRILRSFDQNSEKDPDLKILISETKVLMGAVAHNSNTVTWNHSFKDTIPELLAHIFAVWTLKNTQHYNAMRGIESARAYLLMPHVGQVIAIFRILGIGYKEYKKTKGHTVPLTGKISDDLVNNLVEIGTGEGKSVVMAVTACVFALIGVDVNCSCYSEVLSMRDKNDFASVFQALGIEERIEYGTFNKLCEYLLNDQCDVREKVRDMILNNRSALAIDRTTVCLRPKVLLVDEVDVFLSDKFYGGMYTPSVYLRDSSIKALLDTIWQNRTVKTLNGIKVMPAYKACATQYTNWVFLLDEAIKDMLAALQSFRSSTYIVQSDKIVYIEGESIVDNVVRGYDTIWAYYYESERGDISQSSLQANVGIIVNCGTFSYAEMPHEFAYITGVTGTLRTLAQPEKDILKRVYAVHKNTFMPSVFGISNRAFNSNTDVYVVKESEYFMTIRGDIDVVCNATRAILVFFESEEKLMMFYNSPELSSIKKDVQIITEKVSVKDRERCIKCAATEGRVTLLTRTFGRGTDFICRNQQLLAYGGIHVLQTFFSEELSEEYQIMGRGARQGDRGSYRMILLDKDLEWVLGSAWKEELPKIAGSTLYRTLDRDRNARYESKCGAKELGIEQCKREHKASREFMTALSAGNMKIVKRFLLEQNRGANLGTRGSSRTVLLMDATCSMASLLSAAKETVCTMFERASAILIEKNLPSDAFQMQFAIYRNYNSKENKILQVSPWETKANNLRAFMNTISPEGGWGEEAIEIGLWHAVKESEMQDSISQVILIGDAPANIQQVVSEKRAHFGEAYWRKTRFSTPTYYAHELQKLKGKNIPVHSFYLTDYAKDNFRKISSETGGRCEQLYIHFSDGAESLINLVTEEVLRKTAGAQGDAAVELYRTKYVKLTYAF